LREKQKKEGSTPSFRTWKKRGGSLYDGAAPEEGGKGEVLPKKKQPLLKKRKKEKAGRGRKGEGGTLAHGGEVMPCLDEETPRSSPLQCESQEKSRRGKRPLSLGGDVEQKEKGGRLEVGFQGVTA